MVTELMSNGDVKPVIEEMLTTTASLLSSP